MVKEGATTCFEARGKEQKWNTSLCHPWASSPVIILIEDIMGIKIAEPGWRKIDFESKIPAALGNFTFQIPTPQGKIRVECKDGKAVLNFIDGTQYYENDIKE
jgi:translation initiation factor IF-1